MKGDGKLRSMSEKKVYKNDDFDPDFDLGGSALFLLFQITDN